MIVTDNPLCLSKSPKDADAIPLPSEERTPPEIKIYFVFFAAMFDAIVYVYKKRDANALLIRVSPNHRENITCA